VTTSSTKTNTGSPFCKGLPFIWDDTNYLHTIIGVNMGKKRRLNSSKAKFGTKHANHPRMALLRKMKSTEDTKEEESIKPEKPPTPEPPKEVKLEATKEKKVTTTRKKTTRKAPARRRPRTKKKKTVETSV